MPTIPRLLDPVQVLELQSYRTHYNLYDHLIAIDYKDGAKMVPGLATSWERIDDRTLELTLRDGVKFHDGSVMTADDVVFTFGDVRMRSKDSVGHPVMQNFLASIESVVALSPGKVRVTASKSDPVLELRMSGWGSQIISKAAFEKAGSFEAFGRAPVGTGPYKLESLSTDELRLVPHAEYWGGAPNLQSLVFKMVPEMSSRIAGLISGEFHLITDLAPDQFNVVSNSGDLEVVGGPNAYLRCIKFDGRNPLMKDVKLRRALSLAIDRQAIVDALWAGRVQVTRSHQLENYGEMYLPDHPLTQYNPDLARQLVAESSYKGEVIPYRIRNNFYAAEVATAQVVMAMWEAVGIKTKIEIVENFGQTIAMPGVGIRNGADPALVLDPLFALWRNYGPSDREQWENEEFFQLGKTLETSTDIEERKKVLEQMLTIFDNDPPATVLHTIGIFYGKVKSLDWTPYTQVYMDFRANNASIPG
jgi:peptide/nickel transport system substrate-binding protein